MKFKGKTFYTGDVTKRPVWNTSLVKKHLTPVHSYKNQYGKHPVCLFKQSDVKSKEKQVWFVKALAKYKKRIGGKSLAQRKVISQKAIDTKRAKVVEFITQLCDDIDFGDDSYDQLLRDAVDHRNDWQAGRYSNYDDMDTNIDKETQQRIIFNHVRHNLSDYDSLYGRLHGLVGKWEGIGLYRAAVYDKLAQQYPNQF